jgi:16S rRNA (guanine527-N7)-methyltransferase
VTDLVRLLERKSGDALGRPITGAERDTIYKYLNLLIKWQRSQRLVGSNEPSWIVDHVIVDSLLFSRALPAGVRSVADVGSGAGIPGIPLAIVLPQVEVTLIEARQKRASFLAAAIRELTLRNCRLVNRRLEDVGHQQLGARVDAVVMRCAGSPTALVPQVLQILAPGGVVIASGPPKRAVISLGSWLEIEGPDRTRLFWVYHAG